MKTPLFTCVALTLMALPVLPVAAQTLTGVTLEPAQVQLGQSVTARIALENTDNPNCGLRVRWGDGVRDDVKVVNPAALPLVMTHTYAKPGDYAVVIEPGKVTSHFKCGGRNQTATVRVLAPVVVTPPPKAPALATVAQATGPVCPAGWTLSKKSVVKKTGAYTCTAKPGTALPAERQNCPGDLSYFENAKKGQLGCKI
ncbi:MAG: hypothetical protein ACKVOO_07425 [Burkholderiaceae bacterium]